jgi:hypothetical protein
MAAILLDGLLYYVTGVSVLIGIAGGLHYARQDMYRISAMLRLLFWALLLGLVAALWRDPTLTTTGASRPAGLHRIWITQDWLAATPGTRMVIRTITGLTGATLFAAAGTTALLLRRRTLLRRGTELEPRIHGGTGPDGSE